MEIPCPTCGKSVQVPDESAPIDPKRCFPFCSERCKLVDLGRWLDGKYQIPVVEGDRDEGDAAGPLKPGANLDEDDDL